MFKSSWATEAEILATSEIYNLKFFYTLRQAKRTNGIGIRGMNTLIIINPI